jgi:hypothetical protein
MDDESMILWWMAVLAAIGILGSVMLVGMLA